MKVGAARPFRKTLWALTGLFALTAASTVRAKDPELTLDASTLLSGTTAERGGWRSVLVRLQNTSSVGVTGSIEVEARFAWARAGERLATRLPFSLAAGESARIEAPIRAPGGPEASIRVRALDSGGRILVETGLVSQHPADALVLHLQAPSRILPVLRGALFSSGRGRTTGRGPRIGTIGVTSAPVDQKNGDPLLPTRAAGYSEATLVLASLRGLARLSDAEGAAIAAWVLSGGALALSPDPPEHLAQPLLRALAGGALTRTTPNARLAESTLFIVPWNEADQDPASPTPFQSLRLAPSPHTLGLLVGTQGGNLRPTEWGTSGSYGLGEVHFLAFDPDDPIVASDPWTRHKLSDLIRHAFDREPLAVLRLSSQSPDMGVDGVRRELDPNQTNRWTIGASAAVLLLYAVLAGPFGFYRAARKGRPLRALFQLPLWSAATLGIVVLLGVFGKGITGKARRLAMVEAGAGSTWGAALFFRGFYAASSQDLLVRAGGREHVLDLIGSGSDVPRTLGVDRDGPRLTGLRTRPWQTLLVREEGFFDLSGGISVLADGKDFVIHNRAGRDLIGVVVKPPAQVARYIQRIRDGGSAAVSGGQPLALVPATAHGTPGALSAHSFAETLDTDFPGLGRAWRALEPAVSGGGEWWPSDVPVLVAALDGGQGKLQDSGLQVDYDRVLVRVVGLGGLP